MGLSLRVMNSRNFVRENDILHILTAPGHPATNGLAERYAGEFKDRLGKIEDTGESVQTKLDRFLLTYRATPTALVKSPSELLMNRQPRIRFSALRAKSSKQEVKVFQDNLDTKLQFTPYQAVFVRNFGKGAKWIPGTIVGTVSPRNFEVQVVDIICVSIYNFLVHYNLQFPGTSRVFTFKYGRVLTP